jgi:hypothetical protein
MKNSAWIIALIALAISACTSQKQATTFVDDDVYNTNTPKKQSAAVVAPAATPGEQIVTSPDKSKAQKPASSKFEEDYNDYSYASRLERFNSKDTTKGYFDETYAGSASGVAEGNSDPNVNVYLGYGAGYAPSFSFGMGWGYPYYGYGWDYGWGYPYYGYSYGWGYPYYYPWYSPWYNPWYSSCCYCYGYNEIYPPYYGNDTYYGSRKTLYGSDGTSASSNTRNSLTSANNDYQRNENREVTPTSRNSQAPVTRVPASQEKYRYTRPTTERQSGYQRTTGTATQRTTQTQGQVTRQQPAPRYVRPENVNPAERSGSAQSYSSPVYRQPKSSQEYLAPRTQNTNATRTTQSSGTRSESGSVGSDSRQRTTPSNTGRSYTSPSRSSSSGSSAPARTNQNTVSPGRSSGSSGSYSAPARSSSGGSYSAPSNSGSSGSYSAPSRSGGSSGGSSGGGSSSGGGGRRR